MSTRKRTNSKSQPPALVQAYSLVSRAEEARTSGHWEEAVDMYNQASELFLLATNHTSDIETIKQLQLLSQAQSSKALEIQRQLRRFSDPNKASPRGTDPIPVPGRTYSQSSASPPSISDPGSTPPAFNASPSSMSPNAAIPNYVNTPTGSNRSTPNSSYNSSSNILSQGPVPQIPQEPSLQTTSQFVNNQGRESFLQGSQNYFLGQAPSAANSVNEILLYQPKPGQPGMQGYSSDTATIPVQSSEVRINPGNYSNHNSPINSTVTNRGLGVGMESYMGQIPQQQQSFQTMTSPRNSRSNMDEISLTDSTPNYMGGHYDNEGSDNPLMNLIPNLDLNNIWNWMEKMLDILPIKPIANMTNFGYTNTPSPQGQPTPSNGTPPASLLNSFYIVPSNQGNPNMYRMSSPPPPNAKRSSLTMTEEEAHNAVKSVQLEEENKQLKEMIQKMQQENDQLRKVCDNGIQYYNDMLKQSIVQFKNEFQKRAKQAAHQQMFNSVNLTPQTATYSQFLGSGKPPLMSQSQASNYSTQINPEKEYILQLEQRVTELSNQLRMMNEKSIKQQRLIEKYEQRFHNLTEENRIRRNMSEQSGINHSIGSHPMSTSGMSLGGSLSDTGSVYTSGLKSNMHDTQYQSVLNPSDNEYEPDLLTSSILQTKDQLSNLKLQQ